MKTANIRREIFLALLTLVLAMGVALALASTALNIRMERQRLDENLNNVARTLARSEPVRAILSEGDGEASLRELVGALSGVDVVSVVGADGIRAFHTNPALMGSAYDGTPPRFDEGVTGDTGPSGAQRRAYAAVYDGSGRYLGFVLAVLLDENLNRLIGSAALLHLACTAAILLLAAALSRRLSGRIKNLLCGYEPAVFGPMFRVRENILECLEEGILEADGSGRTVYQNHAAAAMLGDGARLPANLLGGERQKGVAFRTSGGREILADVIPTAGGGGLCILRDRSEYTRLMEDLTGARYLAEAMRANNHDFTNKLHVILGLLEMGETDKARSYITGVAALQQEVIRQIVRAIDEPAVAALLIGKYGRAAELNIRFSLEPGSRLTHDGPAIPSGSLVTILGNLLDNAMDAINEGTGTEREVTAGIFSSPGAILLRVDDTGPGIARDKQEAIFEAGVSTRGTSRGTGLCQVRQLARAYGGTVTVESEPGEGASFTVTLTGEGEARDV